MDYVEFQTLFSAPIRNGFYKAKEFQGRGVRLVKMNQLFSERVLRSMAAGYELIELTEKEKQTRLLQRDDLLFSRTSVVADGVGKCSIVDEVHQELTWDSNIIRVRLDPALSCPQYYFYLFNSPQGRDIVKRLSSGSAITTITGSGLGSSRVPSPSITRQQRIAGILSAYDELIENSQRRIKILETMARSLYREWFVHFRFPGHENHLRVASTLGEIPKGWEVKKLGDISSYINRGITPTYDEEGDSIVINQKCVRDQRLNLEPARKQSKAVSNEKRVCFGDVLINSTGVGTLGRVAQVYENLENYTIDTHVTIARAGRDTDLDFYGCCLLSLQETFERLGVGATGQTELGRAAISDIYLAISPINLQRQFGRAVHGMRSATETYGKQIQNLRRTRDLLLPRLLSGQINVEAP